MPAPMLAMVSRRSRSQPRDWSHEPVVQPTEPTVTTTPAQNRLRPSARTSIRVRKVSTPKKAPAASIRTLTLAARPVPVGR